MVYFLVNNNYQLFEARKIAKTLCENGKKCALILVPHTLSVENIGEGFERVTIFESPSRLRWLWAWGKYVKYYFTVRSILNPKKQDTLFFFSEFELLNHLIAHRFAKEGAKAYLFEDGGVGTYILLAIDKRQPYSWKDYVRQVMIWLIPGMYRTHFTKFDSLLFPMLADDYLSGVCLYRNMEVKRKVRVMNVERPPFKSFMPCKGRAVFLNQPLYSEGILPSQDYFKVLEEVVRALDVGFNEVYFKFHPREKLESRIKISTFLLGVCPRIIFMDDAPFEVFLHDIRPEVVASFNSTPLLNLGGSGAQPLFLFHLFEQLAEQESFAQLQRLLSTWEYEFVRDFAGVCTGYSSGEKFYAEHSNVNIRDLA